MLAHASRPLHLPQIWAPGLLGLSLRQLFYIQKPASLLCPEVCMNLRQKTDIMAAPEFMRVHGVESSLYSGQGDEMRWLWGAQQDTPLRPELTSLSLRTGTATVTLQTSLCMTAECCGLWPSGCGTAGIRLRITEFLRLEKTSKTTESNH